MRLARFVPIALLAFSVAVTAESKNPSDYPLRIHVFSRSETTFYHRRVEEEAKGEGRANLFENGQPKGVDFTFDCSEKMKASFGFETYPAKWKKPGQELVVLMPVFGKSNSYFTCDFKTDVKSFTYASHNGSLTSEPAEQFKAWMVKHEYDPEHGKNQPVKLAPAAGTAKPAGEQ